MLDLIIISKSTVERTESELKSGKKPLYYISPIYNNLHGDKFYIKSRMLTDTKIGGPMRSASFRAVLTDLSDEKFVV